VLRRGSWVFSSTMDDVPVVGLLVAAVLRLVLGPYFYIPSLITMVRWRFILTGVYEQRALTAGDCVIYLRRTGFFT